MKPRLQTRQQGGKERDRKESNRVEMVVAMGVGVGGWGVKCQLLNCHGCAEKLLCLAFESITVFGCQVVAL